MSALPHNQLTFLDDTAPPDAAARKQGAPPRRDGELIVRAEDLPESLAQMCELIGLDKTLSLVRLFGGTRLRIPASPRDGHPLLRVLTHAQGRLLGSHYGGDDLYIPSLARLRRRERNRRLRAAYDAGATAHELARSEGLSERSITTILNAPEES